MKKILVISDTHCGAYGGLTHPDYWPTIKRVGESWHRVITETWMWFEKQIKSIGPVDTLLDLGDAIEGDQKRQGGVQLLTADIDKQIEMARAIRSIISYKTAAGVFGTPYHTGYNRDNERAVYDGYDQTGDELNLDCNGLIVNIRHAGISKSGAPTGGDISLRKIGLWAQKLHLTHGYPLPDLMLRGHIHEHRQIREPGMNVMSAPALSTFTRYGSKKCTGIIHFGLMILTVKGGKQWDVEARTLKFKNLVDITPARMC